VARIRTVKPEVSKHELLFELEQELQAPVRFAWVMLPGQCDREGRFKWRPRSLKTDIIPYDNCDFSRVLDAWVTRGLLVKYRVGDAWFGCIPTFLKHQAVNPRETASELPALTEADEVIDHRYQAHTNASGTRPARVSDASPTRHDLAHGEGKGREGKGKELCVSGQPDDAWRDVTECDPEAYESWLAYRDAEHEPVPARVRIEHAKFLAGQGTPEQQRELVATCIRLQFKRLHKPMENGAGRGWRKTYADHDRESASRLAALPGDDPGPM
jgi:hypothetical protein